MKIRVLATTLIVAAACSTTPPPPPASLPSQAVMVIADCRAPATPTTASTEGPYFKAGSPEKASLASAGMAGTRIQLIGQVLTRGCAPVARAKVDIWQADAAGVYDNSGYTLRGHVFTDTQGKYSIETIVPAPYPGRTPHIHVKVTPPSGATLTTQLYFPDSAQNASDGIFRSDLVMKVSPQAPVVGSFVFVLDLP